MKKTIIKLIPIAFMLVSSGQLSVMANDETADDVIVVTAQKRSQSINDVGITMSAYTGEDLKDQGVVTAEDLEPLIPGLTVTATSTTGVPVYSIRGVGFQDYSTSASSTVGLYLDEISMPYAVMSRGVLFDVERVEVLKGPQGDLYGRNTTAGQINFVSNKPTDDFEAGVTASYARFNVFDIEGYASGPFTDNIKGRLAVKTTQSSDGWQQSLSRDDELGEKDVMALRGLLEMDISDEINLLLNAHWLDDQSDNMAAMAYDGTALFGTPTANSLGPGIDPATDIPFGNNDSRAADWNPGQWKPRRDNQLKGISANFNWDINDDLSLTAVAGLDNFQRDEWSDWDGTAFLDSNINNVTEIDTQSLEMRLSSHGNDNITWMAGIYYAYDELNEQYDYYMPESRFGIGTFFGLDMVSTRYNQETESKAVFGHAEWQMAESWRLILGARYTEEERTWDGCTFDSGSGNLSAFWNKILGSNLQPGECAIFDDVLSSPGLGSFHNFKDTINTGKWMGKISLDYIFNEDTLFYVTVSSGFKSGGFNGAAAQTHQQLQPYGAEELLNREIGMKGTFQDGSLQFNAAAFWYDYTDKQERQQVITPAGAIGGQTNVPQSRINGAEVDISWYPLEGLAIYFGAAYLDTKIEKWDALDVANSPSWPEPSVTFDASGLELAASPEWQYNGTISYEWDLTDAFFMGIATDFSYRDTVTGVSGSGRGATQTEDYLICNLRLSLEPQDDNWRVTLWTRNIADEYYYPVAVGGGNATYLHMNGMPRTYGVTAEYKFY